jgi:hypothetical protein
MPPSTVAGCTTIKAVRHSRHVLASWIQKSRWAELRAFTDTRQRGQLLTKRCPRQIRPIARRGTTGDFLLGPLPTDPSGSDSTQCAKVNSRRCARIRMLIFARSSFGSNCGSAPMRERGG